VVLYLYYSYMPPWLAHGQFYLLPFYCSAEAE